MVDDRVVRRPRPGRYLVPVACGFVGTVAVVLAVALIGHVGGAGGAPVAAPVPAAASATCTHAPSRDSRGEATSYEPARALDGDPATAWRCVGDGVGQQITVVLAGPAPVARVGLVPGLAKTDPGTARTATPRTGA